MKMLSFANRQVPTSPRTQIEAVRHFEFAEQTVRGLGLPLKYLEH